MTVYSVFKDQAADFLWLYLNCTCSSCKFLLPRRYSFEVIHDLKICNQGLSQSAQPVRLPNQQRCLCCRFQFVQWCLRQHLTAPQAVPVYTGLLHQYSDYCGVFRPPFTTTTVKMVRFGKRSGNFFVLPVCSLQQSSGVVCQRFLKIGAKKAANLFQDLLLICRCDGRRY